MAGRNLARLGARTLAAVMLVGAPAVAGCGAPARTESGATTVRAWADALRAGDAAAAAGRFAPSAVVDLGGRPVELVTPRAARFFHESLPCAAAVAGTSAVGPAVLARLRLVETPRGTCAGAEGDEVLAAFAVRDGRIVALRALTPPLHPVPSRR